ncbi:hypothetical protein N7495_006723 [Penicillium taxi]|uniref:uncharacterized protein n=1 Tax=Penicillium taxi TaxID=168475 RepID=UPI002545AC2C|nr:uncharacterized protein N7495_006723 [Penicillium taxi]KAJ5895032.1 hypothetical protein N7495_006723 [Penicillium taxi]
MSNSKRGEEASCTFVGRGPRGKSQTGCSSSTVVQDRLKHLENMVMSLAKIQIPNEQITDFNTGRPENVAVYNTPPSTSNRETRSSAHDTGKLVVKDEVTSYIDSANWRVILEEINGVKEYLNEQEETYSKNGFEGDPYDKSSPVLLLGMSKPVSREELLSDIPPRSISDRLVSRFLKTTEPVLITIHVPTFRKEYERFWSNPDDMSLTWIGYLYSIINLAVVVYIRSEEPLPLDMQDPMNTWDVFRKRASQCLVQGNYLSPGRHKCEAMFLYSMVEFYRNQDAQIGVSHLFGMTIRLAMRMGYHRDPSHYSNLSPWAGEMRRRLWAVLCQLDVLISFQVGLPRTILSSYCDAEPPSNLLDTDFDESSNKLPFPRPIEERTPSSYTKAKSYLMDVFGEIVDLAYTREPASYDKIKTLDRRLDEARKRLPPFFKIRPMAESIGDPSSLIISRYALELLYQKARIVLHRRYMADTQDKYCYSRNVCLNAAKQTLQHHSEIWIESLTGGQLYTDRFLINSLQNTDFMLSSMVLCLALIQDNEGGSSSRLEVHEQKELLALVETTYGIFGQKKGRSVDVQRAYVALGIMLSRVKGTQIESLEQPTNSVDVGLQLMPTTMDQQQYPFSFAEMQDIMQSTETPSYSSLGVIEDMLNTPAQMDWSLYDSRMYGVETTNRDKWIPESADLSTMDFGLYPSGPSEM